MTTPLFVAALATAALLWEGRRTGRIRPVLAATAQRCWLPLLTAGLGLLGLVFLAREVVQAQVYLLDDVLLATASFTLLWLGALRFAGATAWAFETLLRVPAWGWAAFVFAAALTSGQLLFDDLPHTSDEAAYLFQARTFALGTLALPVPEHLDFFGFIHITEHEGRWHGIMNPGWPALLVPGVWAGLEGLVNPLLAALTVLALHGAAIAAGLAARTTRIAMLLFATSPLALFLAGTYMAHTASLALFAVFLWAWARLHAQARDGGGGLGWAALAGLALGVNATVRPLDAAVVALPFVAHTLWLALRDRRWWPRLWATGVLAAAGVAALLSYNGALTGEPTVFPQELHFAKNAPDQRFGFGFGTDMGTRLHGERWPGYYLADAPRVTSQRLLQWLVDLHGAPWISLAAILLGVGAAWRKSWARLCIASAALLVVAYLAHFYHGLAFGARHYALALPSLALALAVPIGRTLYSGDARHATALRAALVALLVHTAAFAIPPLVREHGTNYRMASGAIRDAARREHLGHALVFVHPDRWGWKSGFPLNHLPLAANDVLYARDLGRRNDELRQAHPDRAAFRARFGRGGRVEIRPLSRKLSRAPDASRG